jgi:hypothetical protein
MHPARVLIAGLALGACGAPADTTSARSETSGQYDGVTAGQAHEPRSEEAEGTGMSEAEILIVTDKGQLRARLADNNAARALAKMLPLRVQMRDHLRQEKTGTLPAPLPDGERQSDFAVGTLGLWGDRDFVIYYAEGRVPAPGIVVLGQVSGDLSQFDSAGRVTIALRHAE